MPALDVARGIAFVAIALTSGTVAFAALVWLPVLRATLQRGGGGAGRRRDGARPARGSARPRPRAGRAARVAGGPRGRGDRARCRRPAGDARARSAGALGAASFLVLAGLAWRAPQRAGRAPAAPAVWLAGAAALTFVPGVTGNAGGEDPAAVLVAASALHVAAASVWAGGIACLLLAVPAGLDSLPAPARSAQLAELAARFSAIALIAVVVLALSGVIQGLALVGRIDALVTTGYGRLVLVKGALLCLLALAGAIHRGRTLPGAARARPRPAQRRGPPRRRFRRLLGGEALLLAAVFTATAVLAGDDARRRASGRRQRQRARDRWARPRSRSSRGPGARATTG